MATHEIEMSFLKSPIKINYDHLFGEVHWTSSFSCMINCSLVTENANARAFIKLQERKGNLYGTRDDSTSQVPNPEYHNA